MPRQRFLENNEKLTKANILTKAKALKNRATREVATIKQIKSEALTEK